MSHPFLSIGLGFLFGVLVGMLLSETLRSRGQEEWWIHTVHLPPGSLNPAESEEVSRDPFDALFITVDNLGHTRVSSHYINSTRELLDCHGIVGISPYPVPSKLNTVGVICVSVGDDA